MYVIASKDRTFAGKHYDKTDLGRQTATFDPGSRFDVVTPLNQLRPQALAAAIKKSFLPQCLLIPNLPKDGSTTDFELTKRYLQNNDRKLVCLHLKGDAISAASLSLHDAVKAHLSHLHFPENIAFVAFWAGATFLNYSVKKMEAYVLLPLRESISQDKYRELLEIAGSDTRLAERGSLIPLASPTYSFGLWSANTHRYDEIIYQDGDYLDANEYIGSAGKPIIETAIRYYDRIWKEIANKEFYGAINRYLGKAKRKGLYSNIPRLCETVSFLIQSGGIKRKEDALSQILYYAIHSNLTDDETISLILEHEPLSNIMSLEGLRSLQAKVISDFVMRSKGGDIQRMFLPDETIEVNHKSLADLTEEEWERLYIENGLIILLSNEGTGKTYYGIREIVERKDPETLIGIFHRKALAKDYGSLLGLIFQEDLGDNPSLSIQERKAFYGSDPEQNPAILIQSIQYTRKDGSIVKRELGICDELEHVLEELTVLGDGNVYHSKREQYARDYETFLTLVNSCDLFIGASASLSLIQSGYFLMDLPDWERKEKRLLVNHWDYINGMRFSKKTSEAEAIAEGIAAIRNGEKVVFVTDNGTDGSDKPINAIARTIRKILDLDDNELKACDANTFRGAKGANLQNNAWNVFPELFNQGLVALVHSPVFDVGWQLARPERENQFDKVVLVSSNGWTHAQTLIQMFRRYRFTRDVIAYVKPTRGFWLKDAEKDEAA
ncbi:MAG: hypothetical protein CBB97_25540 [Candidatus Endolissoclinum sp. TMED37]|nr:MAG: hypothetical protein CBB97_25540 [Candidatus Endolissoclinum sp. TMED37]|tara:strand:+ start:1267 stop:3438 length:2172 start_codon:yes stop_codon:yes gene_type:complete